MNKEASIAIPADPTDRDDGAVSAAGLERRRIRKLRTRLGLSQVEFAERYAVPRVALHPCRSSISLYGRLYQVALPEPCRIK